MPSMRQSVVLSVAVATLVLAGLAVPALASPAPVSACPPCSNGFISSAADHGLETEVQHSEATVRIHENGSATWTVRVVPTNESALNRLAENESLAVAVAGDSFGVRYGDGIQHELLSADVADGAFVMEYRTIDVVERGPFGSQILTYFRDSPGAYIYTDLGADELTVVAPAGTTVARGFGELSGDRMTATSLPERRNGPFVVFAPEGTPLPGVVGWLAVVSALGGVILRNTLLFVVLPGSVLVGGLAGIRRFVDAETERRPERLGAVVAAGGVALVVGSAYAEVSVLPEVTANFLTGLLVGGTLLGLGTAVGRPGTRDHLSSRRLLAAGVAVAVLGVFAQGFVRGGSLHRSLSMGVGLLPAAVALGWADGGASGAGETAPRRLFAVLAVAIVALLVATAPLTALGGTLFLLMPIFSTVISVGVVVAAVPLYLLGAAGVAAAGE